MNDVADRRIFVGGLLPFTTSHDLTAFFEKFGGVEDSNIVLDKQTGNSKGYGFVTFREQAGAIAATLDPSPVINGKICNCNMSSKGVQSDAVQNAKRDRATWNQQQQQNFGRGAMIMNNNYGGRTNYSVPMQNQAWGDKRPRTNVQPRPSITYVQRLRQQGTNITKPSATEKIDRDRKTDPCGAFKYFLEVADLFRGSPEFNFYSQTLLDQARHFRKTGEVKEIDDSAEAKQNIQAAAQALEQQQQNQEDSANFDGFQEYEESDEKNNESESIQAETQEQSEFAQ
jgi:RNA recognition motif-containing protein